MRCGLIKVNRSVSMTTGVHGIREGMKISVFSCWWRKDSVWVWKCNWNISLGCQWNRSIWLLRFLCEDVGFLLLVAIATLAAMSRLQVMPCLRFFFFLNRHVCFPLIHYFYSYYIVYCRLFTDARCRCIVACFYSASTFPWVTSKALFYHYSYNMPALNSLLLAN